MVKKLLATARRAICHRLRSGYLRPVIYALVLIVSLFLFPTAPVRGRWEVFRTVEPPRAEHTSISAETATEPTATPIPIPDRARVPILMYHYVSELPPDADSLRRDLTVSPDDFRAQLQYLAEAGYHPITLTDLYLHLTQGYPLPEKPTVLTFDDGYRDAYDVVFPILLDYGFPGTFFVLASPAEYESADYLTWAQIKEMSDAGMAIEGHGRDHVDLRGQSYDYLVYQILGIQEAIHYHTGRLPRFFCYPSGQYDADVVAVLKSAGYWGAVTTRWEKEHTLEKLFEMGRVRIRGSDTLESFVGKLEE
jgi:peptidoglycan/xylan/chitin deacetylase (PgdA/CDA1 family)